MGRTSKFLLSEQQCTPTSTNKSPISRTGLEEMITQYMKTTHGHIKVLAKTCEEAKKLNEVSIKNMEIQMGQISTQHSNMTRTWFLGTTLDIPRNETCTMVVVEDQRSK